MYELEDIFPDMPSMTEDMRLGLHRKYAPKYIFYERRNAVIDCYCTNCLQGFKLHFTEIPDNPVAEERLELAMRIRHKRQIQCPLCGEKAMARSAGYSRKSLSDYTNLVYFIPCNDAVYAVSGFLKHEYADGWDMDGMRARYRGSLFWSEWAIRLKPGSVLTAIRDWGGWSKSEKLREPYYAYQGTYSEHYTEFYNPEVLQGTFLRYMLPKWLKPMDKWEHFDYGGCKPLLYMMYAARYPAFEMLQRLGATEIIRDIVDRSHKYKRVLDLDGKTPAEVFKTDSNEAAIIRKAIQQDNIGVEVLQCYKSIKHADSRCKMADAQEVVRRYKYRDFVKLMTDTHTTKAKLSNYLTREKALLYDYKDYITECKELGYDITDVRINHPRCFKDAHERTSSALRALIQEARDKELAEKNKIYRESVYLDYVKRYEYADNKYCVIVPTSAKAIVDEGANQGHCVAGYAERHINGKVCILFMRDAKAPETALYTIEMSGNACVQIRGKLNCDPTTQAQEWFKNYLKWVALPESKKHPKKSKKTA